MAKPVEAAYVKAGMRLKKIKTVTAFQRELKKYLNNNLVLHLSTCRNDVPRSTPLEFRFCDMSFYILSEGGGKFANLEKNKKVAFSIAAPYNSEEDYLGFKGVQAWGSAKVYRRRENPKKFNDSLKKMNIMKSLKNLGIKELPPEVNYRIIEIVPDRIRYGNPREGIYWITRYRTG